MQQHTCPRSLPAQLSCMPKCKRAAFDAYTWNVKTCGRKHSSRRAACEESVAAAMHQHLAYCYASMLPNRCW